MEFQGLSTDRSVIENLQLVKYGLGEQYHFHTDWFTNPQDANAWLGGNRHSSFFAYVAVSDDITGGGTNFPMLDAPMDSKWCHLIDCDEMWDSGVTFRPIAGNAVFWQNLNADGSGDSRVLHAGLPVTNGTKVGMNIWTRQGMLPADMKGPEIEI